MPAAGSAAAGNPRGQTPVWQPPSNRYGFAWQPNRKLEERNSPKTNLGSEGLASADRNNKATLLLTAPCLTLKSSARDLFPRMVKLQYADRETRAFDRGTRCQPAMTHGLSLFLYEYGCVGVKIITF
ncbi:hypothetical protein B8V09_00430 [Streptococcus agalactiae]|nr:hypothetical protein B8V09_00430 [Streptococcus agalactiae]